MIHLLNLALILSTQILQRLGSLIIQLIDSKQFLSGLLIQSSQLSIIKLLLLQISLLIIFLLRMLQQTISLNKWILLLSVLLLRHELGVEFKHRLCVD